MSVKKLFGKHQSLKVVSAKSLSDLGTDAESANNIVSTAKNIERYIPPIDFSTASNFARYGLAEKYYYDAVKRVYTQYPYDGSDAEKADYLLSSSYLDTYLFDKKYPRTTGYVILSADGWGTPIADTDGYGAPATASYEYISIKGGPHTALDSTAALSTGFSGDHNQNNVFSVADKRASNLALDPAEGTTVEFWLKKTAFNASNTKKEVIFDLWNNEDTSSAGYGRLRIELSASAIAGASPFRITYMSGTDGFSNELIGSSDVTVSSVADDTWNHYALSFVSSADNMISRLYVNGSLDDSQTFSTTAELSELTGALVANIGALRSAPSGAAAAVQGWGKLSASLDEFRFWKTRRTAQDVGRYWFTQVPGGANTDAANTSLGVYYKFNEGITTTASIDSVALDYSGRISDGAWTGYGVNSRNMGSAIVSASAAPSEFKDPIIYWQNPDVRATLGDLTLSGSVHDQNNNTAIYNSLPAWISEGDSSGDLKNLIQIIASYFDTLHNQIKVLPTLKSATYLSSSDKPAPFAYNSIASSGMLTPEIFADADILAYISSRDEDRKFDLDLADIKNRIYQNIYNNLVHIYKSKGTEKAFRNLVHCYGVDEQLIRFNTYGNNITYKLKDNFRSTALASNMADFDNPTRFNATVYQQTASSNTNSVSFISGTAGSAIAGNEDFVGCTLEAQVIFPHHLDDCTTGSFSSTFVSASLFGMHSADATDPASMTWPANDYADIRITARRPELFSSDASFRLTSDVSGIPDLSSDLFKDVYDNSRWSFAVRLINQKYPLGDSILGVTSSIATALAPYTLEFYGANYDLDILRDEFKVSTELTAQDGQNFLRSAKRIYAGAHRQNFTGSLLTNTDIKLYSVSYWSDYLEDETLRAHARDPENRGARRSQRNAFQTQTALTGTYVPEDALLAMHWSFADVTGSDASGEFVVNDISSGSVDLQGRYGWLGNIVKAQHTGRGAFFPTSSQKSVDRDYVYVARQALPEIVNSSEMINILTDDSTYFNRSQRPVDYFFSVEKSLNQVVSDDMINAFATIVEFNDLIGDPVNRYRQDYKLMEKARNLFFENIGNTPDLDKFIEFYKWIDSSLSIFLLQLVPASANFSEEVRTVVESHILERNKYWTKFPTIEDFYTGSSTAAAGGMAYSMSPARATPMHDPILMRAPLDLNQAEHEVYWKRRHPRDKAPLATGIAGVDDSKQAMFETLQTGYERDRTRPYYYSTVRSETLHGGVNYPKGKERNIVFATTQPFSAVGSDSTPLNALTFKGENVVDFQNIIEIHNPNERKFYSFKAVSKREQDVGPSSGTYTSVAKGTIAAPFTLVSASVNSGYNASVETRFKTGSVLANLHSDTFSADNSIPMQGPFTQQHVGGHQSRHVDINRYDSSRSTTAGLSDYTTRAEAWRMALGLKYSGASTSAIVAIAPADYVSGAAYPQSALNRATYYRDEGAKRPVNIRNIQHTTASVTLGNYSKNYQVVNTVGRSANNRYFIENNGMTLPSLFETTLPQTTNVNTWVGVNPQVPIATTVTASTSPFNTSGVRLIGTGYCGPVEGTWCPGWRMTGSLLDPTVGGTDTDAFSFSMWLTCSAPIPGSIETLFSLGEKNRPRHWMWLDNNDLINFHADYTTTNCVWISDAVVISASAPESYHIAMAYEQGAAPPLVYINGSPIAGTLTSTAAGVLKPLTSPSCVGYSEVAGGGGGRTDPFHGTIAEASLWKEKLSAAEILEIYSRGNDYDLPGPQDLTGHSAYSDLVGWWRFGEGTGSGPYAGGEDSVQASPYYIYDQKNEINLTGGIGRCRQELIYFSSSYLDVAGGGTWTPSTTTENAGGNYFGHRQNMPSLLSNRFASTTNYTVNNRTSNESVFVNRFAAPGGPEVSSLGYLDIAAEEKSVYNALPWRNLAVRSSGSGEENSPATIRVMDQLNKQRGLRTLLTLHSGKFGFDPTYGSVSALTYVTQPSYQKNPRNTLSQLKFSGVQGYAEEGAVSTGSVYDNAYVSYSIPRSDLQYSWITSSYVTSRIYGHAWGDSFVSNSSGVYQAIDFVSSSNISAAGLKVDFVNMNTLINDPLDLANNIVSASSGDYRNTALGTLTIPEMLNGLLLHRRGAYGVNTWMQIRGGDNPIARKLRERNLISYVRKNSYGYPLKAGPGSTGVLPKFGSLQKYYEAPVIQKYAPLKQILQINTLTPENTTVQKSVVMQSSYANSLAAFSNVILNNRYNVKEDSKVAYDKIKDLYLNNEDKNPNSPVNELGRVLYKETVYPASINVLSSSIRGRKSYQNNFWRNKRSDRTETGAADLLDLSDTTITQSMWPLDADEDFVGAGSTRAPRYEANSFSGSGVLQNSYCQVHNGNIMNITASAMYARRNTIENIASAVSPVGGIRRSIPGLRRNGTVLYNWKYLWPYNGPTALNNLFAGQTLWETPKNSGKNPWYNSYKDFASQMRLFGKEYSVVPEFKMSDHIDYYVTTAKGDFLANNLNIFEVTGGLTDRNRSDEADFYKTYSTSDFFKLFEVVRNEHAEIADPSAVSLRCKALLKLLPYDGFYPAERTVQMARQFSASYGANVTYTGTHATSSNIAARTFMAPFFAPGLMYNTIKSGIAVDYPMFSASLGVAGLPSVQTLNGMPQANNHSVFLSGSGGLGRFHYRIPFEALVEPEKYITDKDMIDLEPHPSCSINVTASWGGQGDTLYKMMAHNFMAEVPDFFLPEGKMQSLVSKPEGQFEAVKENRKYAARIKVYKSLNVASFRTGTLGYQNPFIPLQDENGSYYPDIFETFTMYSRPSAFGPPCGCGEYLESSKASSPAGYTNINVVYSSGGGLNMPFTPPYYNGECWADIIFTSPRSSTTENPITLQEIFSADNLAVTYTRIGNDWTDNASSDTLFHANNVEYNSMQLDASLNLFGKAEIKKLRYDAETGKPLDATDDIESVWAIQPKFETPMMNFSGAFGDLTIPTWGSASCAFGMWHQYGTLPNDPSKGIFMQITDIPANYIEKALAGDPDLTGSLVDVVGFGTKPQRLGQVASSKIIREAIVAVPFIERKSKRKFFNIAKSKIKKALNAQEGGSIKQMVDAMQRYVFPPTMDFVANPERVRPFAMYIFEFEHALNMQDLSDIWQNLPPRIGYAFDDESNSFKDGNGVMSNEIMQESTISHELLKTELLSDFPNKVQWMVFKVKQKAQKNYFNKVINDQVNPVGKFDRTLGIQVGRKDSTKEFNPEYSYNWPYDFFSLVELVKIDAEVELKKKKDS